MHILPSLVPLLHGILHFFAIQDGLSYLLALPNIICSGFGLLYAYIPTVGSALAAAGTLGAWGWAWWHAGLLFVTGLAVGVAVIVAVVVVEVLVGEGV